MAPKNAFVWSRWDLFPLEVVEHLVFYYRSQYGLTLHVLSPINLGPEPNERRQQYGGGMLRDLMAATYNDYAKDPNVILIGLASVDIYLETAPQWYWAFGQRFGFGRSFDPRYRHAIVSSFRMDERTYAHREDKSLFQTRLRKMFNKYVATMYYDIPVSDDRRSVTYGNIRSVADLDRMSERIPVPAVR